VKEITVFISVIIFSLYGEIVSIISEFDESKESIPMVFDVTLTTICLS